MIPTEGSWVGKPMAFFNCVRHLDFGQLHRSGITNQRDQSRTEAKWEPAALTNFASIGILIKGLRKRKRHRPVRLAAQEVTRLVALRKEVIGARSLLPT